MYGFLRDAIWQFIGAALSLVAILISIYIYIAQQKRKSLTYDIITLTPLLTVQEELVGKVKITYEGKQIQKAYLLVIKVLDDGNTPILPSDFIEPLTFSFSNEIKFLGVEVIDTYPANLNPKLEIGKNSCTISPLLLNKKEAIVLKFLLSNTGTGLGLKSQARIVGINEVGMKPYIYKPYVASGGLLLLAGLGVYIFIVPSLPKTVITVTDAKLLLGLLTATILTVTGLFIMDLPRLMDNYLRRTVAKYYIEKPSDNHNTKAG